ncbi:hypothetical protein IFM89_032014 [Coptis chinensis]|uniref:Uncharacterized protein n=1 Tax=Coptis chinensis TaxID=261450 RepID=A0A835GZ36_9MAGN|nr:hypothetical protein IFM89_032014 [Coptis chinensis]
MGVAKQQTFLLPASRVEWVIIRPVGKTWKYDVLTTCGARNIDLVKSLGANEILDYKTRWSCSKSPFPRVGGRSRWSTSHTLSLVFILSCNIFLCGCSSGGGLEETVFVTGHYCTLIPPPHMVQHWCDEMLLPLGGGSQEGFIRWPRVFSDSKVFGLPIGPSFVAIISKRLTRDGSKTSRSSLMGGGEGMGPVKKTAKALGDALFDESMGPIGQVVVICGRNKSLLSILDALYIFAVVKHL